MPFWGGAIGGVPPFMVMQEILGGDIKFDGPHWQSLSSNAIDFVDRLLDRDFNSRMTAEQVRVPCFTRLIHIYIGDPWHPLSTAQQQLCS